MSLQQIEGEVRRFLSTVEPEVLCIKGEWGVGKTFAWKEFFRSAGIGNNIAMEKIAEVSLFGVSSIADLKAAIFENTVNRTDYFDGPTVSSAGKAMKVVGNQLRKSRHGLEIIGGGLRMPHLVDALKSVSFLAVRDQIVCFDDLERSGSGLRPIDYLGLASYLKESRRCKIVLISNIEKMKEEDRAVFDEQMEKVVDISLTFDPSPVEAMSIVFRGDDAMSEALRAHCIELEISNIRIAKKIERLSSHLLDIISDNRQIIKESAMRAVVLSAIAMFQPGRGLTLQMLKSFNRYFSSKDASDGEKSWRNKITDFGFIGNELDVHIVDGVSKGYFAPEKIREAADVIQRRAELRGENDSYSKAWQLWHQRLTVDDDEVLDAMYQGLKDNISTISLASASAGVTFLRQYGRVEQADEIVDMWISDIEKYQDIGKVDLEAVIADTDEILLNRVKAAVQQRRDQRHPWDILRTAALSRSWDPDDAALLARQSPDDWVNFFDESEGPQLKLFIEWALKFSANESDESRALRDNVVRALEMIASRSPLRKARLKIWGFL